VVSEAGAGHSSGAHIALISWNEIVFLSKTFGRGGDDGRELIIMSDSLDGFVAAQLREHRVPGLSLAISHAGRVVKAQGYGFTDRMEQHPVTPATLFQAASVSKCLTALAVLRLVEQGRLALNEAVYWRLQGWKVPAANAGVAGRVTLRRLLCHNAGFSQHGFPGYAAGEALPTLVEVLNGTAPAKTQAIRLVVASGVEPRYSGGGYTVLQQLLVEVAGRSFPELMRELVLEPLGMTASTFAQPLPERLAAGAALGHGADGQPVPGGAYIYPEMAAAGLWTTAADLACYIMGIQQAYAGHAGAILSAELTREMLTPQAGAYGLGPLVSGTGRALHFHHSGRNKGFDAMLMGMAETGAGVVIMVNANVGPQLLKAILQAGFAERV
jgi:CubicO group peptidase (beta-lactamase class C family)